ncbi:hypothetical protein LLH03_10115 [bacterium]|nr:hypothetical protein [bacterium]
MSTVKGTIHAGVCGFVTTVTASCEDGQNVTLDIQTDCPNMQCLSAALPPVIDCYAQLGGGYEGDFYQAARTCLKGCCCGGCVVPPGLFKAMQVSAGVALPQTVTMEFVKTGD